MKIKMEISKSVFDDHLRDFELADAIYMAAEREFIDFDLDHGTSEEMKAVREKLHSACADREFYAVVLCKYLLSCKDLICFEADLVDAPADVPEDAPEDAPENSPAADLVDAPEDSPAVDPVDAPEDSPAVDPVDAPEDSPADAPADVPVNCLFCCYFGDPDPFDPEHRQPLQCCFVPDEDYDDMPCADGNSRSPAPSARASPGDKPLSV